MMSHLVIHDQSFPASTLIPVRVVGVTVVAIHVRCAGTTARMVVLEEFLIVGALNGELTVSRITAVPDAAVTNTGEK